MWLSLLVLVVVYLGGGVAYNHQRGESGTALIPNYDFWQNFLDLVGVCLENTNDEIDFMRLSIDFLPTLHQLQLRQHQQQYQH